MRGEAGSLCEQGAAHDAPGLEGAGAEDHLTGGEGDGAGRGSFEQERELCGSVCVEVEGEALRGVGMQLELEGFRGDEGGEPVGRGGPSAVEVAGGEEEGEDEQAHDGFSVKAKGLS